MFTVSVLFRVPVFSRYIELITGFNQDGQPSDIRVGVLCSIVHSNRESNPELLRVGMDNITGWRRSDNLRFVGDIKTW